MWQVYVHKTKWNGCKAKMLVKGYKIYYQRVQPPETVLAFFWMKPYKNMQ